MKATGPPRTPKTVNETVNYAMTTSDNLAVANQRKLLNCHPTNLNKQLPPLTFGATTNDLLRNRTNLIANSKKR